MKRSFKMGALGAGIALSTASFVAVMPGMAADPSDSTTTTVASSTVTEISSNLTGGLTLVTGDGTVELPVAPGSAFTGQFDSATGDLTGTVDIADGTFDYAVTSPVETTATISYTFTNGGPITNGRIEPDGTVSFDDVQTLALTNIAVLGSDFPLLETCRFSNIHLAYTGTFDDATGTINVTSATIETPDLDGACGMIGTIDVTGMLADALGGSTTTSHLSFVAGIEDITPPVTPEEPTEPTVPTTPGKTGPIADTAKPAAPIAGNPSYTG